MSEHETEKLELIDGTGIASTEDIAKIIEALEPTLKDYPPDHQFIAAASLVLIIMNPYITLEQLTKGVDGLTMWAVKYTHSCVEKEFENIPKEQMN